MILPDLFGHIFYIFILIGTILLTKKNKNGWLCRIIGDIGWVIVGYFLGLSSIIFWSSIFALNEIKGYLTWKWSEDENSKLQGKRTEITTTYSQKNTGNIQSTRRRCSKQTIREPGTGRDVKRKSPVYSTPLNRSEKHKNIPLPKRTRASKSKRKTRTNSSSSMETSGKGIR